MISRFIIVILLSFGMLNVAGQLNNQVQIRQKIVKLPNLKGVDRINSLNSIAWYYASSSNYKHYDSVSLFALPAINESRKLGYKEGLFFGLYIHGYNSIRVNFVKTEILLKEALELIDSLDKVVEFIRLDKKILKFDKDTLRRAIYPSLMNSMWGQGRYKEALEFSRLCFEYDKKIGREWQSPHAATAGIYMEMGNYEKAFEYAKENLEWAKKRKMIRNAYSTMGNIYRNIGDFETARQYFDEGFKRNGSDNGPDKYENRNYYSSMGDLFVDLKNYDSAYWFYSKALKGYPTHIFHRQKLALLELARGNYSLAQRQLNNLVIEMQKYSLGNNWQIETLNGLCESYLHFKEFKKSLQFGRRALELGKKLVKEGLRSGLLNCFHPFITT